MFLSYLNITAIITWIALSFMMFLRTAQQEQAEKELSFIKANLKRHGLKFYYDKLVMKLEQE